MSIGISSSWRGVVGVIKPTYRPGSLEEFIRLLPEGIGVIPMFLGITTGKEEEFVGAMEAMKIKIAEMARLQVDLIHPESSSLFMLRGYQGAADIVRSLEAEHGIPIVTSGMTHVEALRALGVKRMLGITYHQGEINQKNGSYFRDAGFEVLGMEGMSFPFAQLGTLPPQEVYGFIKKQYLKYQDVQGIYMQGSGWRTLGIIQALEQDLQVPIVHPVPARVWAIQKRLSVRQPMQGYGRLLAEMP